MRETACDVLVVGAGPAGLAAAVAAAEGGSAVIVLDENPHPGGQIWRPEHPAADPSRAAASSTAAEAPSPPPLHRHARAWHLRARKRGVIFETGVTVFDAPKPDRLLAVGADGEALAITAHRVILATGATERFLPFPGWTLPGVMGVGGLQAMVKSGMGVRGKRVLLAGSGPLLLAVAASLLDHGAHVVGVAEQASRSAVVRFGLGLWRHPRKLCQAGRLFARLRAVPMLHGAWPTRADGTDSVEQVTVATPGRPRPFEVDLLACAFGLVPRTELARLLGCATTNEAGQERVVVDRWQRTTVAKVLCAGEPTGIGGVDLALAEGTVAGHTAAGAMPHANRATRRRDRSLAFARRLDRAYSLQEALHTLADDDTIVCRCEDVTWQAVRTCSSARQAKLQTRCGMGPCQGKVCGPALAFLKGRTSATHGTATGWSSDRARPPLVPVSVDTLIDAGRSCRAASPAAIPSVPTPVPPTPTTITARLQESSL